MTPATRQQPGASIGGKYRLEEPLARGGMGSVWRARHVELGVPVAIKFMDGEMASSSSAEGRFAREAKAAAALRHPNIVDVRDYGVDSGLPYLVMELLVGEDLGARLKRARRFSIAQTAVIVSQVAKALRRAHEAGIIHRDLKPANVFLARVDDEEVVKLLDFGIAKDTAASSAGDATRTGELMGSPPLHEPGADPRGPRISTAAAISGRSGSSSSAASRGGCPSTARRWAR